MNKQNKNMQVHNPTNTQKHPPVTTNEDIWFHSDAAEKLRIREFWLQLSESDRKALVKLEKDAVLKKMKDQQRTSCSCHVCGRKKSVIEEELEILYDAYYEELENFANDPHPPRKAFKFNPETLHSINHNILQTTIPPHHHFNHHFNHHHSHIQHSTDIQEFGNNLTVKVADDFLKNDGHKFLSLMEELASRRIRQIEDEHDKNHDNNNSDDDEWDDVYDEDDAEDDEYEDEDEDSPSEQQRMAEGRRMFQLFAAKMFEQRVLTAYREKVAQERQRRLLQEIEDEERMKEQRDLEKERKKQQKRALKKQKEEERLALELAKKQEAELALQQKLEAERKLVAEENAKKELEKQRLLKIENTRLEAERRKKEAELKKIKQAEEKRLLKEKKEREEKLEKEREEQARLERKKEKEERLKQAKRERKERKAREKQEQLDKELANASSESLAYTDVDTPHSLVSSASLPNQRPLDLENMALLSNIHQSKCTPPPGMLQTPNSVSMPPQGMGMVGRPTGQGMGMGLGILSGNNVSSNIHQDPFMLQPQMMIKTPISSTLTSSDKATSQSTLNNSSPLLRNPPGLHQPSSMDKAFSNMNYHSSKEIHIPFNQAGIIGQKNAHLFPENQTFLGGISASQRPAPIQRPISSPGGIGGMAHSTSTNMLNNANEITLRLSGLYDEPDEFVRISSLGGEIFSGSDKETWELNSNAKLLTTMAPTSQSLADPWSNHPQNLSVSTPQVLTHQQFVQMQTSGSFSMIQQQTMRPHSDNIPQPTLPLQHTWSHNGGYFNLK